MNQLDSKDTLSGVDNARKEHLRMENSFKEVRIKIKNEGIKSHLIDQPNLQIGYVPIRRTHLLIQNREKTATNKTHHLIHADTTLPMFLIGLS